jgi:hypothetical protein
MTATHPSSQRGRGALCDQFARVGQRTTLYSTQPVLQSRRNLLNHLEAKMSGFAAKPWECLTDTQQLMTRPSALDDRHVLRELRGRGQI